MKNEKRLSDVTREASANRANKFADSIMPVAPKLKTNPPKEEPVAEVQTTDQPNPVNQPVEAVPAPAQTPTPVPTPPKAERSRKSGGIVVEEVVNANLPGDEAFNKMVRITDEHHELLRLLAFKYRKPMNVIAHNLLDLLNQAYLKEQKDA